MSSEGIVSPDHVNPVAFSCAEQSANRLPSAPAGRHIELVDAHGNLVQIPLENLRFVNPNATARSNVVPTPTPLAHDDPDHPKNMELRKCSGSLYRCDCTLDQLWKGTVTAIYDCTLDQLCVVIMVIAILCLFITAWAVDELSYSFEDSEADSKCGWIEFSAKVDEWRVNVPYTHKCYNRDDYYWVYYRGYWCNTLGASVSSLIFSITAALLTLRGLVRTKWPYRCCKCHAFWWFFLALLSTLISILVWVAGDDLCLSTASNDYLDEEYDLYSDYKLGRSVYYNIAASALLGVISLISWCSWFNEMKQNQKVVAHRAANLAPSASGPSAPMMEGIHQL